MVGVIANDERSVYGDASLVYTSDFNAGPGTVGFLDARFNNIVAEDGGVLDKRSFSIDNIPVSGAGRRVGGGNAGLAREYQDVVFAGPDHEEVFGTFVEPNFHNGNSLHGAFGADKQ